MIVHFGPGGRRRRCEGDQEDQRQADAVRPTIPLPRIDANDAGDRVFSVWEREDYVTGTEWQ